MTFPESSKLKDLSHELRLLIIYLLDAAKQYILFSDASLLEEALDAITKEEKESLQSVLTHIHVEHILSSAQIFVEALKSRHLAPIVFISPAYLLKQCPETRLKTEVISDLLLHDLILRLTHYCTHAPVLVRVGIYTAWLKADEETSTARLLSDCICQSNAPLLQKLVQMIGDASMASRELQAVKDRIEPMSDRELAHVLDDAQVVDLFETFETVSTAAGSIGQGHMAKLVDGTDVFVKVKRNDIADIMEEEADLFNAAVTRHDSRATSPWSQMASNLIKETSFETEIANQKRLKQQWTLDRNVHIVDILSHHPEHDPTVLIMKIAPGTTLGRASIRFPVGLENAVEVLQAFMRQFYANTLFYDSDRPTSLSDDVDQLGYSPADPHGGNQMIHVDEVTGEVNLTIIDTASICTITRAQRDQSIDLLVAVLMQDAHGIVQIFGIPEADFILHSKACAIYRQILQEDLTSTSIHGHVLTRLVRIIEATKLVLNHPALDDLLLFGKAQLQLFDLIAQFQASHAYEMGKLGLKFETLTQLIMQQVMMKSESNRQLYRRILSAVTSGAGRKFADAFTPWDWEADGRDGNKTWPFGL